MSLQAPSFLTRSSPSGTLSSSNLIEPAIRGLRKERERQFRYEEGDQWELCAASVEYFIRGYCKIYDVERKDWIAFDLWREQQEVLATVDANQLTVILKARQLGLTWLILCYFLWLMIFKPIAKLAVFSLRENEAIYLLSSERMRGVYERLPDFLKVATYDDSSRHWSLVNGSSIRAFPTSAGDSYTLTAALIDEADLVPDLKKLMARVKPTIDGGGKLILLSRSDKSQPASEFKAIYRAAKQRLTNWVAVFLAWWVRPARTEQWYEEQCRDAMTNSGSLDDVHEQYPATDAEALAPRSLDKRIPPAWLHQCYQECEPMDLSSIWDAPSINGLRVYRRPEAGKRYVIGIDPAEGNPTSNDSALTVMDWDSGEECAGLNGKFEPSVIAAHADTIGQWFNRASLMVLRNNHGHAVILWLQTHSQLRLLTGLDGKHGWPEQPRTKSLMWDDTADAFKAGDCVLHSFIAFTQLCSIEGASLKAPEGEPDDVADSYAACCVARARNKPAQAPATGGVRKQVKQFKVR